MHEATLENDMESTALEHGHSTPRLVTKQSYARPLSLHFLSKKALITKTRKYLTGKKTIFVDWQ
jgi:ribonuclease BN (tRNA processing enzyme)